MMRNLFALTLTAIFAASFALPASARSSFVEDGASMFSASTVSSLNQTIGDFNRQTGKEVLVVTVPSLDGATAPDAAEKVFAQQQVNGVLIFLAKAEKKDGIIGDRASDTFFPSGSFDSIRSAMRGYFQTGDFDTGITTGVNLVLSQYRSHERSMGAANHSTSYVPSSSQSVGGGGMSLIWLILILIAGFLVIRAVFRAIAGGNRTAPPGYGGQGPGPMGYGGGMPGMGYGGGGGGGSFFSGLLGGLGGAFLGNELFGHQNFGNNMGNTNAGDMSGGYNNSGDSGGWQSDPGQADAGNSSFGDYGSSGGGFGDGGGFGGGDGGGGGDSGGGW